MEKKKIFYGWWIVIACVFITATAVPPVAALNSVFTIPITESLNITRTVFSLRALITSIVGILLAPMVGKIMKKYGMRKVHSIALLGLALSLAANVFVYNVAMFYIVSFLMGVFFIFAVLIPVSIVFNNWFIEKRGLAMSIAMAGIGIGGFVLTPALSKLLSSYDWRISYLFFAAMILVFAFPAACFILKESPEKMGLHPLGSENLKKQSEATDQAQSTDAVIQTKKVNLTFSEASKKQFFIFLLVGALFAGLATMGSLGQMSPAATQEYGPSVQAAMVMIFSIVGIFGKLLLGWIDDRFGITTSTLYGTIMFCLAFICFLVASSPVFIYIAAVFYGLGNAISSVSPPLVTASIFNKNDYPTAYGWVSSAMGVGNATGGLITSVIYDQTQSYTPVWITLIIMTICMFIFWSGAIRMSKKYC